MPIAGPKAKATASASWATAAKEAASAKAPPAGKLIPPVAAGKVTATKVAAAKAPGKATEDGVGISGVAAAASAAQAAKQQRTAQAKGKSGDAAWWAGLYGGLFGMWGMSPWDAKGKGKGKGKSKGSGKGLNDFPNEKKAWIGDLPEGITFKELQAHVDQVKKSKWVEVWGNGMGGAAFETPEDCQEAISQLNGTTLNDKEIQVDVWTGKEKKEGDEENENKKKRKSSWGGGGGWGSNKMMKGGWAPAWGGPWGPAAWGPAALGKGGPAAAWGWPADHKVDESGGVVGDFTGKIKSYNEMKGWGFIECQEVKETYDRDVFLYGPQKKGYKVGHVVRFTCVLNKEGKPQAKDLKSGL